jgi:uncharacterized membrane protein
LRASSNKTWPALVSATLLLAQLILELADIEAQRWLRDEQPLRRSPEVQFFRHGNEIAQLLQVHGGVV